VIEVQGLTKRYGPRVAISDVTFSVPRGQVLGFLGPNGAGKSTAMRILTGYLSASSGTAAIAGFDVFSQSREVRRRVGYLPETTPLYNEQRVQPFLQLVCRLHGVEPQRRRRLVERAIDSCGLGERRRDIIGRLSKGLRQRVGLAQAVVHEPDVLILDEPTAGLDPGQTRETRELIVELGRDHTVILSSHILPEVQATCERVVIVNAGRIVADDTPAGLQRRHRGGEEQVEALVRGPRERVVAVLESVPGVGLVSARETREHEVEAVISGSGGDLQDRIAKALVGADLGLRALRPRSRSLEELFLEVVEEAPRAGRGRKAVPDRNPSEHAPRAPTGDTGRGHERVLVEPEAGALPATDQRPARPGRERSGRRGPGGRSARGQSGAGWAEEEEGGSWRDRPGAVDDDEG
jgi:ABC-2 type transport system ATP-binding protein